MFGPSAGWSFGISIHALREESDEESFGAPELPPTFQSTLSVRRATIRDGLPILTLITFQSTLSVRRATDGLREMARSIDISIHALREESDK